MARDWCSMSDFLEDMEVLRYSGYTNKQDYCDRLGISMHCFEQRITRARSRGLLPKPKIGGRYPFDPFGDLT